jgi:hypothetical protein
MLRSAASFCLMRQRVRASNETRMGNAWVPLVPGEGKG